MHEPAHSPVRRWGAFTGLIAASVFFLAPLVWMVSTSLKPESQAASEAISLLPSPVADTPAIAADNYRAVWTDDSINFPLYLRNTLIVALLSVVGMVLSSAVVAYGFSRVKWRLSGPLFVIVLATMMIPFPVLMTPLFVLFSKFGWIGTLKPLWVPAWFGAAFNIFLLRQFYMGIPRELDEAARIDGCSHWGIFWRIILPLSRPALAVVALFHFMYVWNDFLAPMVFVVHRDHFTLALGLQLYQNKAGNTPWNLLMAASTLVAAPVLILFMATQRTFIRGLTGGGSKE